MASNDLTPEQIQEFEFRAKMIELEQAGKTQSDEDLPLSKRGGDVNVHNMVVAPLQIARAMVQGWLGSVGYLTTKFAAPPGMMMGEDGGKGINMALRDKTAKAVEQAVSYEPTNPKARASLELLGYPMTHVAKYLKKGDEALGMGPGQTPIQDAVKFVSTVPILSAETGGAAPLIDTTTRAGAVRTFLDRNIPVPLHQRTGGTGLVPRLAGAAEALKGPHPDAHIQQVRFNQEAMSEAGMMPTPKPGVEPPTKPHPTEMKKADDRLGLIYDHLGKEINIVADMPLGDSIGEVLVAAQKNLSPAEYKVVVNQAKDILGKIDPKTNTIPGTAHQRWRTDMRRVTQGQSTVSPYTSEMVSAVQEAMERSATPAQASLLSQTNRQYAALQRIKDAIRGEPSANIYPENLWNAHTTRKQIRQTVYGEGDQKLVDLARSGAILTRADQPLSNLMPITPLGAAQSLNSQPGLIAGGIGALTGARTLNQNQVTAAILGGRGTRPKPLMTKKAWLATAATLKDPEARKKAIANVEKAFGPAE